MTNARYACTCGSQVCDSCQQRSTKHDILKFKHQIELFMDKKKRKAQAPQKNNGIRVTGKK